MSFPVSSRLAGVAVLVSPDIPLQLGLDSRQHFCLQSLPSMERLPLQYTVCVAHNVRAAHQEAVQQLSQHPRVMPNMKTMWSVSVLYLREVCNPGGGTVIPSESLQSVLMCSRLPFWKLLANVDSGPKVERELRTFSNRLRRHQLGEGVISLNEHSTNLLSDMVCVSNVLKCYFFPLVVHIQQKAAAGWLFIHHYLQQSSG